VVTRAQASVYFGASFLLIEGAMMERNFTRDVAVIGGCGHVGLPLALTLAHQGFTTVIYDINVEAVRAVREGTLPYWERGAKEILDRVLEKGTLEVSDRPDALSECEYLVLIIGTPVDEHLNPDFSGIMRAVDDCLPYLRDGQVLVLRSTVFPGVSERVQHYFQTKGLDIRVAFCPERVAGGHSLREFRELPQIISAFDRATALRVRRLFEGFAAEIVEMAPAEAELAKLMTNAWRYLQFAAVNQFYMIATEHGLDFERILHACRYNYPRMAGMPGPGFSAGPCLKKDTMQLAAFSRDHFVLGHAAMLVNEGLPAHLIELAKRRTSLWDKTVGVLGMAFKAESDDARDSLSYKLKKLLAMEAKTVLCSDPYVKDAGLCSVQRLLQECDVIFVGAPHETYRGLEIPATTVVIDVWSCLTRERA
jgi:UDP-N-acetyl-D-mannosaminuronic acid dehydrogenase